MKSSKHILLVAPSAPPKNSPEAMQVAYFLAMLAHRSVQVTLVTIPLIKSRAEVDERFIVERSGLRVITLHLPFHDFTYRMLTNRRLAALHVPDTEHWQLWCIGQIISQLDSRPDVIYSRSGPFSGTVLARRLKQKLQIPWLMHLSDPWADSPYRNFPPNAADRDRKLEAMCFNDADLITLTTEGQAAHYRARYPARASDIHITPNMMPLITTPLETQRSGNLLKLVYTGAFYGPREPSTLLNALQLLHDRHPTAAERISVDFYGRIPQKHITQIDTTLRCSYRGSVPRAEAMQAQSEADILVTIEPGGDSPFLSHFMPSKNLEYIAARKPILAITPNTSETAKLCGEGYGWSAAPGDAERLAALLNKIATDHAAGEWPPNLPDLATSPYHAKTVTNGILGLLQKLTG